MLKIDLNPNYYCKQPTFGHHTIYDDEFGQIEVPDNDDNIFYDNTYQQQIRDALRNDLYMRVGIVPATSSSKTATNIEEANIINFQRLPNNSYAGGSLIVNKHYFDLLEKSNVTRVIDLAGFQTIENECAARNMKYIPYATNMGFWKNPIFKDNEQIYNEYEKYANTMKTTTIPFSEEKEYMENINAIRRAFVEEFTDLIKVVNEGNFYIGCELGDYRTKNILTLISNLNPGWKGKPFEPYLSEIKEYMINMYKNLTEEEKNRLEFTNEFIQNFEKNFINKETA